MWVIHLEWVDQFKSEIMDFDWVVILDFWAEWCGPCRQLGPILESVSETMPEVKFCKVNVDEGAKIKSGSSNRWL